MKNRPAMHLGGVLRFLVPQSERGAIQASVEIAKKREYSRIVQRIKDEITRFEAPPGADPQRKSTLAPVAELAIINLLISNDTKLSDPNILSVIEAEAAANNRVFFRVLGKALSQMNVNPIMPERRKLILGEWLDRCHFTERCGQRVFTFRHLRYRIRGETPELSIRNETLGLCYFTYRALARYIGIRLHGMEGRPLTVFEGENWQAVRTEVRRLGLASPRKKLVRSVQWKRGRLICEPVEENLE